MGAGVQYVVKGRRFFVSALWRISRQHQYHYQYHHQQQGMNHLPCADEADEDPEHEGHGQLGLVRHVRASRELDLLSSQSATTTKKKRSVVLSWLVVLAHYFELI